MPSRVSGSGHGVLASRSVPRRFGGHHHIHQEKTRDDVRFRTRAAILVAGSTAKSLAAELPMDFGEHGDGEPAGASASWWIVSSAALACRPFRFHGGGAATRSLL